MTQMVKFALVGLAATLSTYLILIISVEFWKVNVILASVAGYIVGIIVNYVLNYGFTFQSKQHHRIIVPKFLVVMIIGLILNICIMFVSINWIGVHYVLAQLIAVAVVLMWSFSANRLWVFTV